MVRVKYRYILAEIVSDAHKNKLKFPLGEHELKQKILNCVQETHGDYGLACIQPGFAIKMYNPATRIFIIRVRRGFHSVLGTTLPLVTSVGKVQLSIRTIHLSGTIRCAYKRLLEFDRQKLNEIICDHRVAQSTKDELAVMTENCQKRLSEK
ncbi:hypothetical protein JTE90_005040 [Oedothorax gibbosus]|uniref:Ribonuclease P/MRP protein subunit POP5 n=1 Tax=Oedothorax gibbosus TaxID=931172 RepID=A0AAV6VCI8_9ARAC|nr:hypothetical protein JTE90_005040 [Oedothorax gibbosus]